MPTRQCLKYSARQFRVLREVSGFSFRTFGRIDAYGDQIRFVTLYRRTGDRYWGFVLQGNRTGS